MMFRRKSMTRVDSLEVSGDLEDEHFCGGWPSKVYASPSHTVVMLLLMPPYRQMQQQGLRNSSCQRANNAFCWP
ncbi:hypothetical protein TNCV_2073651 [Trichonephila clavipes]|nr:hypothetical protein TNCV_2073651 [Trichonephila clavipes]